MTLFSMKMRASRTEGKSTSHVSGAEKILSESELAENAGALIGRALHHAKGDADYIQLKIEKAAPEASPISTRCPSAPSRRRTRRKDARRSCRFWRSWG